MKSLAVLVFALLLGATVNSVSAQSQTRAIAQRNRIIDGLRGGELTHRETRKVINDQRNIRKDYHRFKCNDGYISPRERKHLRKEQRKASHRIYRYKHNNRDRF